MWTFSLWLVRPYIHFGQGPRLSIIVGLIASSAFCAECTASSYAYPYNTMSGAEVVNKLLVRPTNEDDYQERDQAYYYVAGIKDGTQGRAWCFTGSLKPDELTYEIAHSLKRKQSASSLKGNAGPLIVEELKTRYPCKPISGARP
jgi:hypothetical protein